MNISKQWVKDVVGTVLRIERQKDSSVSVLLTDNKSMRKINKRFLKHDYATDVIAFGAGEPGYLGDIVVSAEMAKAVSKELNIPFREELARYLVHGTLHLLGYRDKSPKDKKRMHKRQEAILANVAPADPVPRRHVRR